MADVIRSAARGIIKIAQLTDPHMYHILRDKRMIDSKRTVQGGNLDAADRHGYPFRAGR